MPNPTSVQVPKPAAAPPPPPANGAPDPAAAAAPPPAVEAPKADPKEGKLLADVRARERRAIERETALRTREQEVEARSRQTLERDQLAARDGLAYLKSVGWSDEQIAARLLGGNKPTAADAYQALHRKNEELEQRLARFEQRDQARELEMRRERELEAFEAQAKGVADSHPLASALAKKSPKKLRAMGMRLATEDPSLTNEDILDRIQEELAEYAGLSGPKIEPAPSEPESSPGRASPPGTSPTLTGATANQRASLVEKRSVLKLTAQEQTDQALAAIREARAKATANGKLNGA
jgi:hypothetical protein